MYEATITPDFLYSPGYDVGLNYGKYAKVSLSVAFVYCKSVYNMMRFKYLSVL